ncbi:MAG: hypothetical protein AAGA87_06905 [Pseudomonadota bacterium]
MPKTFERPPMTGLPPLLSKPKPLPGRDDWRTPLKAHPGKAPVMRPKQMPGKGGHL